MRAQDEIAALRAPDELGALARAWTVIRAAHREVSAAHREVGAAHPEVGAAHREVGAAHPEVGAAHREVGAVRRDRPPPLRARRPTMVLVALAPALIALVAALTLTPAGATVTDFIGHALGVPSATSQLALPTSGRLLVTAPGGTFTVSASGSRVRLGPWRQASWSPHGRYLAVAGTGRLAAIDPHGRVQWSLARPAVSDPSWYPPSGYRVAYLSGRRLRVVAGDGTADRPLAAPVARVAPAWRPGHAFQLTYAARGRIVTRDADTGDLIWTVRARGVTDLQWSSAGTRLLVRTRTGVSVLDAHGTAVAAVAAPVVDAVLSPDGRRLALVRGGAHQDVSIAQLPGSPASRAPSIRTLMSAPGADQVAWSPNGRWLLVSWPAANQWVFIAAVGPPRVAAVSRIAGQFAPERGRGAGTGVRLRAAGAGSPATARFPRVDGWCCAAGGG